jgi:hypothetical protein
VPKSFLQPKYHFVYFSSHLPTINVRGGSVEYSENFFMKAGRFAFDLILIYLIKRILEVFIDNFVLNFILVVLIMIILRIGIAFIQGEFEENTE